MAAARPAGSERGAARRAVLVQHPAGRSDAVRSVEVALSRTRAGALALHYTLEGRLDRLRVPAPAASRIADRLWTHTCFELFVACRGAAGYHELNFSPSGEWAAYVFERYREGAPLPDPALDPQVRVRSSADRLELEARVPLERLSSRYAGAPLALGLSAVVEAADGALDYWALAHPPGQPDFHHPAAFALEL